VDCVERGRNKETVVCTCCGTVLSTNWRRRAALFLISIVLLVVLLGILAWAVDINNPSQSRENLHWEFIGASNRTRL
jgi:hypothetical protein